MSIRSGKGRAAQGHHQAPAPGRRILGQKVPVKPKRPFTAEEDEWLMAERRDHPDYSWADHERRYFRRFGTDRGRSSLQHRYKMLVANQQDHR